MDLDSFNIGFGTDIEDQIYTDFNLQSVLWFTLGSEQYAIKVDEVKTVIDEFTITPMPNVPRFVRGIINLRGTIIPIIDLKQMFQMPRQDKEDFMVVVLQIPEVDHVDVGIIVDKVNEVLDIDFSALQPPPPSLSGLGSEYVVGIHKTQSNVLIVVDIVRVVQIAREMVGKYS